MLPLLIGTLVVIVLLAVSVTVAARRNWHLSVDRNSICQHDNLTTAPEKSAASAKLPCIDIDSASIGPTTSMPASMNAPAVIEPTKVETICLVACVGAKATSAAWAKDLYVSDWFIKARAYAEAISPYWFVLSAKHGPVRPDALIEPYEMTLNAMSVSKRKDWAGFVQQQMDESMPDASRIVVLAGQRYREFLMPYLHRRAGTVDVPMEGMRIGEQLSWLRRQSHRAQAR
jgi:hypothetical protein